MKDIEILIKELYSKQGLPTPTTYAEIFATGESVLVAAEVLGEILFACGIMENKLED